MSYRSEQREKQKANPIPDVQPQEGMVTTRRGRRKGLSNPNASESIVNTGAGEIKPLNVGGQTVGANFSGLDNAGINMPVIDPNFSGLGQEGLAPAEAPEVKSLGNTDNLLNPAFDGLAQPATPVGINGSIAPPAQAPYKNAYEDLRNPTNSMEKFVAAGNENILARGVDTQRDFNAQNYDTTPLQPHAPNQAGAMNPEQQMQRMQLQRLTEVATKPIDNSLPYDQRTTLIREQKAAQKALGTLYGADTAGRNRAADSQKADKDYENSKNKATLKGQQNVRKEQAAWSKQTKRFTQEDIMGMEGDYTDNQKAYMSNITVPDASQWKNSALGIPFNDRLAIAESGQIDTFGLTGKVLLDLLEVPYGE